MKHKLIRWPLAAIVLAASAILIIYSARRSQRVPGQEVTSDPPHQQVDAASRSEKIVGGHRATLRSALSPAVAVGGTPANPGRSWQICPIDVSVERSSFGAAFSGTVSIRVRHNSDSWQLCELLAVRADGTIAMNRDRGGALEYQVCANAIVPPVFIIDDRGFATSESSGVKIRVASEPHVSAHHALDGRAINLLNIVERSQLPVGSKPTFNSPGPRGFESNLRTEASPFAARLLEDYKDPLIGGEGLAWKALRPEAARLGGAYALESGESVGVHVNLAPHIGLHDVKALTVQLYPSQAPTWGASAVAAVLDSTLMKARASSWRLQFDGVPVSILSAVALVEGAEGHSAHGWASRVENDSLPITIDMISDALERHVEGFVEFEESAIADLVERIDIFSLDPAPSVEGLFGSQLVPGEGFSPIEMGVLKWQIDGIKPGRYALLLHPLGVYCVVDVVSTVAGMQSLYSSVPRMGTASLKLIDSSGAPVVSARSITISAFLPYEKAARPVIVIGRQLLASDGANANVAITAPEGAQCFVTASCPEGGAETSFKFVSNGAYQVVLPPVVRWISVTRRVTGGDASVPLKWWETHIGLEATDGLEVPWLHRVPVRQESPEINDFGMWGWRMPERRFASIELGLPLEDVFLTLASEYSGATAQRIRVPSHVNALLLDIVGN